MNKKILKRLLVVVIIAIIVILAVIQTPSILLPVLGLVEIILFGAGLRFLLSLKDRLDQKGKIDYGKIPALVIVIASLAGAILVGYMVSIPLAIFAVVADLYLLFCSTTGTSEKQKARSLNLKQEIGFIASLRTTLLFGQ